MIPYPHINPDLLNIGPLRIRWYGVMYVLGFLAAYFLIQAQKRARQIGLTGTAVQDLIFYLAIGVVVGGRLGHVIFFDYSNYRLYLEHPLEIIATWHGGMAFHGGLLGATLMGFWFARRRGIPFWVLADCTIVTAPIGLALGRFGNFINAELLGRASNLPWAMVFPGGGPIARHPTQLYESLMEGVVLFIVLWTLRQRRFRDGMMVPLFLLFYGIFRFIIEFFKEPDLDGGYLLGYFTMGQVLCVLMIAVSGMLAYYLHRTQPFPPEAQEAAINTAAATAEIPATARRRKA